MPWWAKSRAIPLSLPRDGTSYLKAARSGWKPKRVAISRDLGLTPVDPEVADIVMAAARQLRTERASSSRRPIPICARRMTASRCCGPCPIATGMQSLLENHRDKLKPEVIWNIEKGLKLTGAKIATAEAQRGAMFQRTLEFFETYDLLLCPATIVPPFRSNSATCTECNGHEVRDLCRLARHCLCGHQCVLSGHLHPGGLHPGETCPWAFRSSRRREAKHGSWPVPFCLKGFSAFATLPQSTRAQPEPFCGALRLEPRAMSDTNWKKHADWED